MLPFPTKTSTPHHPTPPNLFLALLANHALWIGLGVRVFLAWLLPYLMDSGPVPYTDIDYLVFTDAARYLQQGQSPYDRHTYRYTPFLAEFLAHLPHQDVLARYLFCLADVLCGWMILQFRRENRRHRQELVMARDPTGSTTSQLEEDLILAHLQDAAWWLYNPLAINICTRGSSESLQVLLPVLLTIRIVVGGRHSTSVPQALLAGLCHGIAIHAKLYPIIYSLSYMAYFASASASRRTSTQKPASFPWTRPRALFRLVLLWASKLFQPVPLVFVAAALGTFFGLTYLSILWYGEVALQEGLLYHFSRVDHRHNYSMYWYWIYLARAQAGATASLQTLGRLLLLPQLVLLVYSSLGIAPYNLGLALFVQTYLFVTHNKVITAQYFTWYLCLLPLCCDYFRLTKRVQASLLGLLLSIALWLGSAYCLEMQGMAVHQSVWMASVLYFFANVNLMGALLRSVPMEDETETKKQD